MKPFLKWAGGKRWLLARREFRLPKFTGRYIEPFLGGGAVFFELRPKSSLISDINLDLVETYKAIKDDWRKVWTRLRDYQERHSANFYYEERSRRRNKPHTKAAQFLYMNRACWNGLYRVNLRGEFNVPVGTKSTIIFPDDDFESIAEALADAVIECCDFSSTVSQAKEGDLLFVDPPYTTAHNFNGFAKYNEKIFTWSDQIRLKDALVAARGRGAQVVLTNANHCSVKTLYSGLADFQEVSRQTVISGVSTGRGATSEALLYLR